MMVDCLALRLALLLPRLGMLPVAAVTDADVPASLLRRHSLLTPALKGWLGDKGYLEGSNGVTVADDGRLIATAEIAAGATIIDLPRHLTLSWLTVDPRRDTISVLGRAIEEHPELFPSKLVMPVWLCYERHRKASLFAPYLRALPSKLDLPVLWKAAELAAMNSSWIYTAVQDDLTMMKSTFKTTMSRLCQLYPGPEEAGGLGTEACEVSTWKWAWATLWSRGVFVEVPAPPQPQANGRPAPANGVVAAQALVPLADMANHVMPAHANALSFWDNERLQWVVEASLPIKAGEEILLSYGDELGNAHLLQRFGFVLPTANAAADIVTVQLPLGAPVHERGAAVGRARRALSRSLFDATTDVEPLDLLSPQTADGRHAYQMLLLYAAVRVVDEPAAHIDGFAEGADIAFRFQGELLKDGALHLRALEHVRELLRGILRASDGRSEAANSSAEEWFASGVEAGQITHGTLQFCDDGNAAMRNCRPRLSDASTAATAGTLSSAAKKAAEKAAVAAYRAWCSRVVMSGERATLRSVLAHADSELRSLQSQQIADAGGGKEL